ncbi:MAG TPA: CDP-alcohol phosphatidyltransferase family protein [Saprospiraceae bacterium]|nr:CDP-alcohol phosphatidyltransferase family protein [Saprospiraceae bacterium]
MSLRKTFRFVPNALTLGNLLCGVISLMLGQMEWALIFTAASLFLDLLDGWAARWLGATSDIGLQLDSLADLVSFAVVPAWFVYHLYQGPFGDMALLTGLIPLAAAWRLARFNTENSNNEFSGLPSPAAGMFLMSVVFLKLYYPLSFNNYLSSEGFFLFLVAFTSLSMISQWKLPSFKSGKTGTLIILIPIILQLFLSYWSPLFLVSIVPIYFLSGLVMQR